MVGRRKKHSEKALDERIDEDAGQEEEERGILEVFSRDEDAPLTRNGDADVEK